MWLCLTSLIGWGHIRHLTPSPRLELCGPCCGRNRHVNLFFSGLLGSGSGCRAISGWGCGGRRGEQITLHSAHSEPFPSSSARCPIPYTTDTMSLNPLQPYGVYHFAHSFQKSSRAQENYHKPWPGVVNHLVMRRFIGIPPVAIRMVCITDCCAIQDTQQHQVKQSANYLSLLLCEGCMGFSAGTQELNLVKSAQSALNKIWWVQLM